MSFGIVLRPELGFIPKISAPMSAKFFFKELRISSAVPVTGGLAAFEAGLAASFGAAAEAVFGDGIGGGSVVTFTEPPVCDGCETPVFLGKNV